MTPGAGVPRRLSRLVDYLVDDRVGVLGAVQEVRTDAGAPDFFHFSAQISNTAQLPFSYQPNCGRVGAAGADRASALERTLTHAVAYYCSAFRLDPEEEPRPARGAPFPCVDPSSFALFDSSQFETPDFPWQRFDDLTPVAWKRALDPLRDEAAYLPCAMVFLPFTPLRGQQEPAIAPPTSAGLACHWDPATAAIEAICDVVECDALAITWQARLVAPQVRIETLSDANYDLVSRFEGTGASVRLLSIDLGIGLPTFLAILSNDCPSAPARVFAAGTHPDPERAVRRSLEMLAHTEQYARLLHSWPAGGQAPAESVASQADHIRFWADPRNAKLADFVFSSEDRLEFESLEDLSGATPAAELRALLGRIEGDGHRVLLTELTTPEISDAGLTVVRAVIPGLQPLFYGTFQRALGGNRLWDLPGRLGHPPLDRSAGDNPLPHPFPRRGLMS